MRNSEESKKWRLCLWPRRILWVVVWMNTGVGVCAARSTDEALIWSPGPRWPKAAHGPHPLPRGYASLPGSHLAPGSSAQPPWRFSSWRKQHSIPPGGRPHPSLPVELWLLTALPLSPWAPDHGFQEPDRSTEGHTGDSCCCSCYCAWWPFASSTKTWTLI